jgi:thiol:disulfide interchange protein DsbD
MKRIHALPTLLLTLLSFAFVSAQVNPTSWTYTVNRVSDTEAELLMSVEIDPGWHVYSSSLDTNSSVIPTSVIWEKSDAFTLNGPLTEPEPHEEFDPNFGETLLWHEDGAEFKQKILIHSSEDFSVRGEFTFMVCNDQGCLPPDYIDLDYAIKGAENPVQKETAEINYSTKENVEDSKEEVTEDPDSETVSDSSSEESDDSRSLISIFIFSFLGGFAALLTPCVFPMIPMTVSFFTKQSKTKAAGIRNGVLYGISIIAIYVVLGYGITWIFGADSLNALSTNVTFNLVFFLLLVVFAISFFGAFEIMLPNSWANKVDAQADRGGIIGIIFMALALAIVSFSCTGPIVGTLLVEAASKGGVAPVIGMLGFSSALALPFALFAAFPGWMNSLPKSGGWLNSVKVVLGFLELAFAFKFLSNADLVLQLHLLERETFIAIWIAVFGALALYLFGKIKLPHDSPLTHLSVGRMLFGVLVLSFTIYLIPGMWGAPLKLISGFPPPEKYSESPHGVGYKRHGGGGEVQILPEGAKYGEHDIVTFTDYDKAFAYSKEIGKPLMIDFTGHACVNCRKMEQQVWSDPRVLQILKNDVVLVSLYVDDKRRLPKDEVVTSEISGKKLKYIGQKWSEFQALKYKQNTQPLYVIVDNNEKDLTSPVGYDPDIPLYIDWLEDGISKFKKK